MTFFAKTSVYRAAKIGISLALAASIQGALTSWAAPPSPIHPQAAAPAKPRPSTPPRAIPPQRRRVADYEIFVKLEPDAQRLTGTVIIEFNNTSQEAIRELYFHLYLNAFTHENTVFLREKTTRSGRALRTPGEVTVHALRSPRFPGVELWDEADPHSPDDPDDATDIRVALPAPIAQGDSARFELEFSTAVPDLVERSGAIRGFYLMGQWFPKLAKLEPNGEFRHFPYYSTGEFYADFSNYRVHIDVPEHYVVGSTGHIVRKIKSESRALYEAEAREVIDFAWTAWPDFETTDLRLGPTQVHLLHPPGTDALRDATVRTLSSGLSYLAERFGPYPYADLTVVMPPAFASAAGGMEYPQFITTTGNALLPLSGVRLVELFTFHELTHQWFQSIVASDEVRSPVLDESLTVLLEWTFMDERLTPPGLLDWPDWGWQSWGLSRVAVGRYGYFSGASRRRELAPIASAANELKDFRDLALVIYSRAPLALLTLGHAFGDPGLRRVLTAYVQRFQFRHPTIDDFMQALEETLGSLGRKQAQLMLFENGSLDLRVGAVTTTPHRDRLRSTIQVKHQGVLTLPYSILVTFEDGSSTTILGASDAADKSYELVHERTIARVVIDPERQILLDSNFLDNRWLENRSRWLEDRRDRAGVLLFSVLSWVLGWGAG